MKSGNRRAIQVALCPEWGVWLVFRTGERAGPVGQQGRAGVRLTRAWG